jgi:hypothetical protein
MPVTAKLSKEFYDKFGNAVVDELVNWFNQVDATYRNDLRELNELNFARFDAKLEQRVAHLDAKLQQRVTLLEARIEERSAQLEAKVDRRISELQVELRTGLARLEGGLLARIGLAEGRLARLNAALWIATLAALAAAARTDGAPGWAVPLLIVSLGLTAYCLLEVYLIHVTREPPPPEV